MPLVVSYNRNPNFTGRAKDLDYIYSFLDDIRRDKRPSVPLVVHSTGGIGKTQLVREFVFAHSAKFSSIIWVDAQNSQSVHKSFLSFMCSLLDCYISKSRDISPSYIRITRHLGISTLVGEDGKLAADSAVLDRVVAACLQWLDQEGNTDWLLVFDNVDDLEAFSISDFFPKKEHGSIVITSRRPECSRLGKGWKVGVMELQESLELLSKSYGRTIKESDEGMECPINSLPILADHKLSSQITKRRGGSWKSSAACHWP